MKKVILLCVNPMLDENPSRFFSFTNLTWAYRYAEKILKDLGIPADQSYNQINRTLKSEPMAFLGHFKHDHRLYGPHAVRFQFIQQNPKGEEDGETCESESVETSTD